MSIILITHDLGVVARMADKVAVMYAGRIVENGPVDDVFYRSAHPYTLGLNAAMPTNNPDAEQDLTPIDGSPPDLFDPPKGCAYGARCPYAMRICGPNDPGEFDLSDAHYARLAGFTTRTRRSVSPAFTTGSKPREPSSRSP